MNLMVLGTARWSVRPVRADEFEWALALQAEATGPYISQTLGWDHDEQRAISAEHVFDTSALFVISVGEERVALVRTGERTGSLHLEILELYGAWQGQGIVSEMFPSCPISLPRANARLSVSVLRSDVRALAFYERHGLTVQSSDEHQFRLSSIDGATDLTTGS